MAARAARAAADLHPDIRHCPALLVSRGDQRLRTGRYRRTISRMADFPSGTVTFLFTDVDLKFDTPQYVFRVDADKANRIGVNMADVGTALATMLARWSRWLRCSAGGSP